MTDGCAAQLAAGALREGDWNSVLGTTLVLKGYSSTIVRDPARRPLLATAPRTAAGCRAARRAPARAS